MTSQLDGAGSHLDGARMPHADRATHRLRKLMTVRVAAPDPVSIRWTQTAHKRSAELRRDRIALAAYYLSEARGFVPGHDAEDWLLAQAQIDAIDAAAFEG